MASISMSFWRMQKVLKFYYIAFICCTAAILIATWAFASRKIITNGERAKDEAEQSALNVLGPSMTTRNVVNEFQLSNDINDSPFCEVARSCACGNFSVEEIIKNGEQWVRIKSAIATTSSGNTEFRMKYSNGKATKNLLIVNKIYNYVDIESTKYDCRKDFCIPIRLHSKEVNDFPAFVDIPNFENVDLHFQSNMPRLVGNDTRDGSAIYQITMNVTVKLKREPAHDSNLIMQLPYSVQNITHYINVELSIKSNSGVTYIPDNLLFNINTKESKDDFLYKYITIRSSAGIRFKITGIIHDQYLLVSCDTINEFGLWHRIACKLKPNNQLQDIRNGHIEVTTSLDESHVIRIPYSMNPF